MTVHRVLIVFVLGLAGCMASLAVAQEPVRRFGGLTIQIPGVGVRVDVNRGPGGVGVQVDAPGTRVDVGVPRGIPVEPVFEKRNYVGVFTAPVPDAVAAQLAGTLGAGEGLIVTDIAPDSAAQKAGLQKNDILATYDGTLLTSVAQLQELVAADKARRTVKFEIIRGGKVLDVSVVIGEKLVQVAQAPRILLDPNGIPVHGDAIARAQVPNAGLPPEPAVAVIDRSALLTTADGKSFSLDVAFTDATGLTSRKTLDGTLDEIQQEAGKLAEPERETALRILERHAEEQKAAGDNAVKQDLKFQLNPLIEGKQKILHLQMTRPGKQGELRMLEIDHYYAPNASVKAADLLQLEVLQDELGQLSVEVRVKLEETLRTVELPEAKVNVQNAQ